MAVRVTDQTKSLLYKSEQFQIIPILSKYFLIRIGTKTAKKTVLIFWKELKSFKNAQDVNTVICSQERLFRDSGALGQGSMDYITDRSNLNIGADCQ